MEITTTEAEIGAGAVNPFDGPLARQYSCYATPGSGGLLLRNGPTPAVVDFVHESFRALVLNPNFVCVAAKSAVRRDNYRFGLYEADMGSEAVTPGLAHDLYAFARELPGLRENGFCTFVASFCGPNMADEIAFEKTLWTQLQRLHDLDAPLSPWDASVSSDPADPHFEFSFAGSAFFVVGLHSATSRWTRRFAWPTLVFNAHVQFDQLRGEGKFGRMQNVVRDRDRALQGSVNPNLADFGERSDARQYSGRAVGDEWRCPFHAHARRGN